MIYTDEMKSYINHVHSPHPLFKELLLDAKKNLVPIVTNEVAALLRVFVGRGDFKNILELGCGYGHSTFSMLFEMPEDAHLTTVDCSINSINYVRNEAARLQEQTADKRFSRLHIVEDTAFNFLHRAKAKQERFDFFFIDAMKKEYIDYYELALSISTKSALLFFDNILWKGEVAKESVEGKAASLKKFNEHIMNDPRVNASILPFGDGVALVSLKH